MAEQAMIEGGVRFIVMRRALKSALPWLRMVASEKDRPETSAIHSVVREVEQALETARATLTKGDTDHDDR